MCFASLRQNIEIRIPCAEHSEPQFTWHSSFEEQLSNTNGYR